MKHFYLQIERRNPPPAAIYAAIICVADGVVSFFTSLPLIALSLQSYSQTSP